MEKYKFWKKEFWNKQRIISTLLLEIATLLIIAIIYVVYVNIESWYLTKKFVFMVDKPIFWQILIIIVLVFWILSQCYIYFLLVWKFNANSSKKDLSKKYSSNAEWLIDEREKNVNFKKFNEVFPINPNVAGFVVKTSINKKNKAIDYNVLSDKSTILLGTSGSGKTQKIIIPTIIFNGTKLDDDKKPSMLLTDPKGELFKSTSLILQKNGYSVFCLNFKDLSMSHHFNPLTEIWELYQNYKNASRLGKVFDKAKYFSDCETAISKIAEIIVPVSSKSSSEIWNQLAKSLFEIGIFAFLENSKVKLEDFTLWNIANSLNDAENLKIYLNKPNILNSYATSKSKSILNGEPKQEKSVYITLKSKIDLFQKFAVATLLSKNSFNLNQVIDKPTAIFLITPEETKIWNSIIGLLIKQQYQSLTQISEAQNNRQLPRPFLFILEEFGNIPVIQDFSTYISICRSQKIFFLISIQDFSQIDNLYDKNSAQIIKNNCDLTIFMKSKDMNTKKELMDYIGKITIPKTSESVSESKGGSSSSTSYSEHETYLLNLDDLSKIDDDFGIIILERFNASYIKMLKAYKLYENFNYYNERIEVKVENYQQPKPFYLWSLNGYQVRILNTLRREFDLLKNDEGIFSEFLKNLRIYIINVIEQNWKILVNNEIDYWNKILEDFITLNKRYEDFNESLKASFYAKKSKKEFQQMDRRRIRRNYGKEDLQDLLFQELKEDNDDMENIENLPMENEIDIAKFENKEAIEKKNEVFLELKKMMEQHNNYENNVKKN